MLVREWSAIAWRESDSVALEEHWLVPANREEGNLSTTSEGASRPTGLLTAGLVTSIVIVRPIGKAALSFPVPSTATTIFPV